MTPIQKQMYVNGRNAIAKGMQTLVCINGPFPKGPAKAEAERLFSNFLNDIKKLAEKNGL